MRNASSMALNAPIMSSSQLSIQSPPVKNESGRPGVASKPKTNAQRCNIEKLKKLIEQCEDVLAFVRNEMGEVQLLASTNLKHDKWTIMQDAHETFNQYLQDRDPAPDRALSESLGHPVKGRNQLKKSTQAPELEDNGPDGSISYMMQRPAKRQRSGTATAPNAPVPASIHTRVARERRPRRTSNNEAPAAQIEVNDRERLEQWFREAFLTMQQVACRLVAKVWIKKIHPKKQSTHPYNGGMPRDQPPDSNRTRPPYWPKSVIHREPDHIGRDDRVNLLVHLIMNTPQPIILNPVDSDNQQVVTARDLADCLEEKRAELKEGPWEIIQQVIRTRQMMEQYEAGEIDGDSLVFLNDYSDRSTLAQIESETETGAADGTTNTAASEGSLEDDTAEEHELTPASSTLHSPADQARLEEHHLGGRPRRSVISEHTRIRTSTGQRPRPSSSINQAPSTIVSRVIPDIPADMAMGMGKFECHIDTSIQEAMIQDTGASMSQEHVPAPMMIGVGQQMSPDLPMTGNPFDRELNSAAHEVVVLVDPHRNHDMMRGLSHSIHHQESVSYQPWLGMLPDISPASADDIYSVHPHMALQPHGMQHGFYDQSPTELVGAIQNGLPLMDPATQYQDVNNRHRRNLPVRIMGEPQPGMMPTADHNLDMSHGQYYHI